MTMAALVASIYLLFSFFAPSLLHPARPPFTRSSNVEPDFELKLEVYAVMMETDLTIASTPRKIKNTIHSSISRTVGKKLATTLKDELNNAKMYVYSMNSTHQIFISWCMFHITTLLFAFLLL